MKTIEHKKFVQSEYVQNYHKNNLKRIAFNLNKEHDADIIEFLEGKNKQGYLKDLIRKDMQKNR